MVLLARGPGICTVSVQNVDHVGEELGQMLCELPVTASVPRCGVGWCGAYVLDNVHTYAWR
jgi:hypothetical protein